MATDQVIAYLLLILREGLVFLEKLWYVGLVGHFEHGYPLDGHVGGVACGDVAVNGAFEESGKCEMTHQLYRGDDRKAWRDVWHILGPWFGDRSRLSLRLSVSTVWTSRLVINYLKTTGTPIVYCRRIWGLKTIHTLSAPASSTLGSRWIMASMKRLVR